VRFTLKSMMLCIACAAGFLTLYVQYLAAYIPFWLLAIPCLILLVGYCLWFWRCRRIAGIGFVGLSILSNCVYVVASIYPVWLSESAVDSDLKIVGLFIDPNPGGRTGFVRVHSETLETHSFGLLRGTDTNVELGWGWSYRQDD
jgi:hypothetical protein